MGFWEKVGTCREMLKLQKSQQFMENEDDRGNFPPFYKILLVCFCLSVEGKWSNRHLVGTNVLDIYQIIWVGL